MYALSHVIQVDDLKVRDNLTVETVPLRIEDREVKRLRGKELALVKELYLELFPSCNFQGRKFFKGGEL